MVSTTVICVIAFALSTSPRVDLIQVDGDQADLPEIHTWGITNAAFSPDGKAVFLVEDYVARCLEIESGRELRRYRGHSGVITSLSVSSTGRFLVTGSDDSTARLWNVENGTTIREFKGHSSPVNAVAFSSDDTFVLTGSTDGTARLWEVRTGRQVALFKAGDFEITCVAISNDAHLVVTAGTDSIVRLWDVATGRETRGFAGHSDWIGSVSVSWTTETLMSASSGTVRLWHLDSGKNRMKLVDDYMSGKAALSSDGAVLLTDALDHQISVWDTRTGKIQRQMKGHTERISSIALSRDGSLALTTAYDNTARLWDLKTGVEVRRFDGLPREGCPVCSTTRR